MSRSVSPTRAPGASDLATRFADVRALTAQLCETLTPEDCCIQAMTSASPTRWHLAHTSWFFETFLLKRDPAYRAFDEHYEVLFNSYYNTVGEQFPRDRRGLLSRPTLAEVFAYRGHVDACMVELFASGRIDGDDELATIVEWGVQHEQQHQELILTDVKYLFSINPQLPAFRLPKRAGSSPTPASSSSSTLASPFDWIEYNGGIESIGHAGAGFAYDNESPQHRVLLEPFHLASRPVTSGDFLAFIDDGGYERPELWLSAGWSTVAAERWSSPLYWHKSGGAWQEFTLAGLRPLDELAPVTHVSYFEADAFARWAAARLPTEAEWEVAGREAPLAGNFVDTLLAADRPIHPASQASPASRVVPDPGKFVVPDPGKRVVPDPGKRVVPDPGKRVVPDPGAALNAPVQMLGDVWEWTASPYVAYPGYQPPAGALGEYNGKFMCNQYVLRGGSCATPSTHIRATYRNFFPPEARWQFSGIRLAK